MAAKVNLQQWTLQQENEGLRSRLAETESRLADALEVIAAIQSGEVDAVVVNGPEGEQVFTLRGAESAYRALVEAMTEGAATIAFDGAVLYCNQHLADMLGRPLDRIMGSRFADLLGPDATEKINPLINRALNGLPAKAQMEIPSADGQIISSHVSISKMKVEEPSALCVVVTDLTESKKWEDLISAGKLTNSILDSSAEGIAVCDGTGQILTVNGILKSQCGTNPLFEHFDNAFPLEIGESGKPPSFFTIASSLDHPIRGQEVRLRRPGEPETSLLLSSGQIMDGGSVVGCVLTLTDITRRKRTEEALLRSEKLAIVGRLAASIAHEINNPLEAVTNLIYIARRAGQIAEIRQHLDAAERELRRVSAITTQTLRFHKQSTGPTEITCEALVSAVLSIFQGRILNSNVRVETRYVSGRPIHCFEGEIRQVLCNLIVNSIDAMHPAGGRLLLRCREGHDRAGRDGMFLTVADDGPGMSPEISKRAFEAFFTTKGFCGTGLGLWVCLEIVERHRGKLLLRSTQRPGKSGTVFRLFLPFSAVTDHKPDSNAA